MNVKECYRQYRRGIRCRRKYGDKVRSLYALSAFCCPYIPPQDSSEYWSWIEGWKEKDRPQEEKR